MNKLCNILQGEGDTMIQPFHALIMMAWQIQALENFDQETCVQLAGARQS
jgi:hypothetical protein